MGSGEQAGIKSKLRGLILCTERLLGGLVKMIFSAQKMVRLFGPSKRLMYLKLIFFQMYQYDQKYRCLLQTLWLWLVFSNLKYGQILNIKYS